MPADIAIRDLVPTVLHLFSDTGACCYEIVHMLLQVDFQQKEAELFAPQSVPAWFSWDTKLGSLTLHFDSPQVFAAEVYARALGIQVVLL